MRELFLSATFYLAPPLTHLGELYLQQMATRVRDFITFLQIFVPIFLVSFIALVLVIFFPLISTTNEEIYTKRRMLLCLPAPLVARVPSIQSMVSDMLQSGSQMSK